MKQQLFHYADCTWPEVADLDRDTPLVIPIGAGCPEDALAEHLGKEKAIGVLPFLPYGWKGSIASSSGVVFERLLSELTRSITAAGFSHVVIALPEDLHLDGPGEFLHVSGWLKSTSPIRTEQDLGKVIVIPVGHIEQHGLHLPLSTDSDCIASIGKGIEARVPGNAFSLPVFPYGVSMHQGAFAGTTTINGRTFEDFWIGIIDTFVQRGHRKFYVINGHGGNHSFLVNVIKYAGDQHPEIFCATSWLYLSGPSGIQALETRRESKLGGMGHACELETSLMLAIRPDLVRMERVVDEVDFISTPSYFQDWIEGGALIANPPWEDDTATGAYGAGSYGSAEKGRYWLSAAVGEKIDHIREIEEQYDRRMKKRTLNFQTKKMQKETRGPGEVSA